MPAIALSPRRSLLTLTLAALFAAPSAWAEDSASVRLLLEQASHWEDARRDDLARQSLDKLLRLTPDHPDALARLGRLQLRGGDRPGAERTWRQLQARHPDSASAASLALALRADGPGQQLLQQARALTRQGNIEHALARWRHLLAGAEPDGELAVEYWQTVARRPQGWPQARAGLQTLLQREPGRGLYALALSELWLSHPPLPPELLTRLGELARQPNLRQRARNAWRQALLQASPSPAKQNSIKQYLAQFPEDSALSEQLQREHIELAQAAARLRDPAWRALQSVQPALARGDLADAERALNAARAHQQDPRWLSDAFALRLRQNRFDDAARLVRQGLAREPEQASAWRERAITLRAAVARQQASQALGGRAEHAAALAEGWRQLGEPARALAEFDRLPDTPATRLARAQQLLNLSQLAEAHAQWASVPAPSDELRDTWRSLARQLAEAQARAEPNTELARAHWRTALEHNATPADAARAWRELARLSLASQQAERAVEEALRALALQTDNADAALTLADAWLAAGQRHAARELLAEQAARSTDLNARMAVLERQLQLDDADALAAVWDSLHPAQRQQPAAARLGARLAEQRQRPDHARNILRQAVDASPPRLAQLAPLLAAPAEHAPLLTELATPLAAEQTGQPPLLSQLAAPPASPPLLTELPDDPLAGMRQSLAELDYAQQPEATFSVYHTARNATPGLSSLRRDEGQFTLRGALGGGWQGELALTPTRLDAGTLNDAADGADFAARLLCGPGCAATPRQHANGLGWRLNLSRPDLSAQLGHTPHGFAASTWLGRLNSSGRWGQWGYDWELSRQPLTGSLLSYAGTRDPYSGQSWGGVTANGLALNLSHDQGGALGVWAQLGWHKLLGKNVQDNTRATVMGGVYWRLVDTPWRQVRLGLNTLNWRFAENLSGLTFGHGGYYSPQRYHSLSLPLTWAERGPRWSWWLRGAVSLSRSQENAMPYYPTRPDWQAAAQALPGSTPFYQGGSGRGRGYSLAAAAEYQLDSHWVLGGRLEAERSDFYQPRRALLYLRYTPQGRPTVLPLPVEGVAHP